MLNRLSVRFSRLCQIAMQEAIDWIRGTSKRNNQAMNQYMAGATGFDLFFGHRDVRGDLIAHFMRGNKPVTSLYLNYCEITEAGLLSLLNALQSSTSVEYLSLDGTDLVGQNMAAVANLVKHNRSIKSLDLSGCRIDGNGIALLCEALGDNKSLRHLEWSENSIGSRGAEALGRYLRTNPALTDVGLYSCFDSGDDLTALAAGLKNNTNLEGLELSNCAMRDNMAVVFADALKVNTGLKTLDFSSNNIGVSGLVALARALRVNRNLQKFWFDDRDEELVKDVEVACVDMLCVNVCLTYVGQDPDGYEDTVAYQPPRLSWAPLLCRNEERIPAAVRRAALLVIGVCRRSTNYEGMGAFAIVPKDVVKLIAMEVWATRTDPIWIQAL